MPHMNVLDLPVFPCMPKRHSDKSRESGGLKVLSEAEIWKNAESSYQTVRLPLVIFKLIALQRK
jgi:hypothetical protein